MLSIIIPLRNETENLKNLKENFEKNLTNYSFEVIFINDFICKTIKQTKWRMLSIR